MKLFFENENRQRLLAYVVKQWTGTPFVPHAKVKGAGVDCIQLAAQLYIECGHLKEFVPGAYTMDGGHHNPVSGIITWLDASPHFIRGVYPVMIGDLVCFRIGKSAHHVGVVTSANTFIHARQGYPAGCARIDEPTWLKRLVAVYRPVES